MLSATDASFLASVRPDVPQFFRANGWTVTADKYPEIFDHWYYQTMGPNDYPKNTYPSPEAFVNAIRNQGADPHRAGGSASGTIGPGVGDRVRGIPVTQAKPRSQLDDFVDYIKAKPISLLIIGGIIAYIFIKPKGTVSFNQ